MAIIYEKDKDIGLLGGYPVKKSFFKDNEVLHYDKINKQWIAKTISSNSSDLASQIDAVTVKSPLVDTDTFPLTEPTTLKKTLWSTIKSTLKTYFDTLYALAGHTHIVEGTTISSTGETGGTKFLREDGDGTCSWQDAGGGHTQNTDTGTTGNTFTVDSDSTTGKIIVDVALGAADLSLTLTNEALTSSSKTATLQNKTGTIALTSDIPVKASGTELNASSDDAKFATAKALADSDYLNTNSLPGLTQIETIDAEAHYIWLRDGNDGILKECPISVLKAYFDTLYTPL